MLLQEFLEANPKMPLKRGLNAVLKDRHSSRYYLLGGMMWFEYLQKSDTYTSLLEYFHGDVPKDIDNLFVEDKGWRDRDFILENLRTHDNQKLIDALKKFFGSNFHSAKKYQNRELDSVWVILKGTKESPLEPLYNKLDQELEEFEESQKVSELIKVLQWYGYYLSDVQISGDSIGLLIDPEYPEKLEAPEQGYYRNLYHICSREDAPYIQKNGLRTKWGPTWRKVEGRWQRISSKEMYRYFPKRVHLFALDFKSSADRKVKVDELLKTLGRNRDEIAMFRVTLPGTVNLYQDTAMPGDGSYFCYSSVPPENMQLIFPKELKESSLKMINLILGK